MKIATRALAGLSLAVIVAGAGPAVARAAQPTQAETGTSHQQAQAPSQDADRRLWWKDAETVRELGLSKRQTDKIDRIWQKDAPPIQALRKQLDGLEAEFNRLMKENTAEESVIALQIDRVEAIRSQANKARHLMLYRMHRSLTPAQYSKLTDLLERRRKDRGRR